MSKEKEYKITKDRILAIASGCPEAKAVLKKGFPEAFEEEKKWEFITGELDLYCSGEYSADNVYCFSRDGTIIFWGQIQIMKSNPLYDVKFEKGEIHARKIR